MALQFKQENKDGTKDFILAEDFDANEHGLCPVCGEALKDFAPVDGCPDPSCWNERWSMPPAEANQTRIAYHRICHHFITRLEQLSGVKSECYLVKWLGNSTLEKAEENFYDRVTSQAPMLFTAPVQVHSQFPAAALMARALVGVWRFDGINFHTAMKTDGKDKVSFASTDIHPDPLFHQAIAAGRSAGKTARMKRLLNEWSDKDLPAKAVYDPGKKIPEWMEKPFNQLSPARAERLAMLAEECAEVIQIIGKILRHGWDNSKNSLREPNYILLGDELCDLLICMTLMDVAGEFKLDSVPDRAAAKHATRRAENIHHNKGLIPKVVERLPNVIGRMSSKESNLAPGFGTDAWGGPKDPTEGKLVIEDDNPDWDGNQEKYPR